MPCFHPLHGYKSRTTGQWISEDRVSLQDRIHYQRLTIPCSKCTGCRTEHSRQWAMRLVHEKKHQEEVEKNRTVFVTLTYNDDYLPKSGTLIKKDFQKFIKRLRNQLKKNTRMATTTQILWRRRIRRKIITTTLSRNTL